MMKTDTFEIKLIDTVKKFGMFKNNDRVLVGLSGGKDSVALLYSLNKLSSYLGISLVAFHLNHGIRGEEANRDQRFSESFCRSLSIPFVSDYVDVPSQKAVSSHGMEAVARDMRYSALQRVAKDNNCNKIATAHTASDNSETVMITLMRNSFAKGIPAVRQNIVRPLIYHTTAEVLDYCKRNELEYVTDSTNYDTHYTRNFIRNNVLNEFYKLSPSLDESISHFSEIQIANLALNDYAVECYLKENSDPTSLTSLMTLTENKAFYNVLYSVITRCLNVTVSYRQFDDLINVLINGDTGSRVSVGQGKYIVKDYDRLTVQIGDIGLDDFEFVLKHGENPIPDSNISLWVETPEEYNARNNAKQIKINKLTKNILIKYNIIKNVLVVRSRKQGDSYVCRGITRSIKKYMVDEKIPKAIRSRIPIVCDDNGIVWVPGLGIADRVKDFDSDNDFVSFSLEFKN